MVTHHDTALLALYNTLHRRGTFLAHFRKMVAMWGLNLWF